MTVRSIGARLAAVAAGAAAALLLASAPPAAAAPPIGDGEGGVRAKLIERFSSPVYAAAAPGRRNRKLLFVVEQQGVVRVLRRNRKLRKPFIDISDRVLSGGERGLLSIAFHPRYVKNRRFYLYYTDSQGDIRVSQFRRRKGKKTRAKRREREIIDIPHRDAPNHNGGTVAFGPDRRMYIGTGDGGGGCDPPGNAQNPRSLLGKLLRIKPRARGGYRVPRKNPFVGAGPRDEIYSLGLRNPFRFSFDRRTDTIAIGDVGQGEWEEIDYETLAGAAGANFGWNVFEGTEPAGCGVDPGAPIRGAHTEPIHQYRHSGGGHTGCSVTGGLVVRDRRLASLYGRYLFADFCTGDLRSLIPEAAGARDEGGVGVELPSPTSFVEGRRKRVYATSLDGGIYRIKPDRPASREKRAGDGRGRIARK